MRSRIEGPHLTLTPVSSEDHGHDEAELAAGPFGVLRVEQCTFESLLRIRGIVKRKQALFTEHGQLPPLADTNTKPQT
jgi:hypothetical protein